MPPPAGPAAAVPAQPVAYLRYRYPVSLLALLLLLSAVTLHSWTSSPDFAITGDEPHYLILASGISRHLTFDPTPAYEQEFRTHEIYPLGLAPPGADPSPENAHVVRGPHGLRSIHSLGLPLLLAVPFRIGGVLGAQLFLLLFAGAAAVVAWRISGVFSSDNRYRLLASASVLLGLPLVPAASRIYPDIVAGLICLAALTWLLTNDRRRRTVVDVAVSLAIAYLPWLQIKFVAPALVLAGGALHFLNQERRDPWRSAMVLGPLCASLVALAVFNSYAYGNAFGPYEGNALQVSATSFMVLLGLHLDQNQGLLLQNPVLWVGVFSVGALFARGRGFAVVWLLVYASLILPNAMHPNWYGGFCFSGRFQWAGTIVFMVPTLLGLSRLAERAPRAFHLVVGGGALLQAVCFVEYAFRQTDLFNRSPDVSRDFYSIFYGPVSGFLPALYAENWAYRYAPNLAFLVIALGGLGVGLARERGGILRRSATAPPGVVRPMRIESQQR